MCVGVSVSGIKLRSFSKLLKLLLKAKKHVFLAGSSTRVLIPATNTHCGAPARHVPGGAPSHTHERKGILYLPLITLHN